MRFAIRDDDACYFTSAEQLERLWGRVLPYAPVSLAVTPFAVPSFHLGDIERFYQGTMSRPLGENVELADWIRRGLRGGRLAVMCHGYTHEYRRVAPVRLLQEYVWKAYDRLSRETASGKLYLESVTGTTVDTFVPPGNGISRAGMDAVRPHFRKVLATLALRRVSDIRVNREYLASYGRRLYYQIRHRGANPFGECVAGLRLIPSFSITPLVSWEQVRDRFDLCHRLGADFIAAVHYWEVTGRVKDMLFRLLDRAAHSGCAFRSCPELFGPAAPAGDGESNHGTLPGLCDAESAQMLSCGPFDTLPEGDREGVPARAVTRICLGG